MDNNGEFEGEAREICTLSPTGAGAMQYSISIQSCRGWVVWLSLDLPGCMLLPQYRWHRPCPIISSKFDVRNRPYLNKPAIPWPANRCLNQETTLPQQITGRVF